MEFSGRCRCPAQIAPIVPRHPRLSAGSRDLHLLRDALPEFFGRLLGHSNAVARDQWGEVADGSALRKRVPRLAG